jgi:Phage terminase large subunit
MSWYSPLAGGVVVEGAARAVPITPTPSQYRYIVSEATIVAIVGPMGEGKSFASIMGLLYHAHRCQAPLRCAIIRDTHENLKGSVVVAFQEFFQMAGMTDQVKWTDQFHHLDIRTDPPISIDLFGIDDLAALTRLQGPEYGLIWLEEPCPYTDSNRANAGLSEDVFNAALVRCARQKGTKARLQLSFNPPDEDHWVWARVLSAPDGMVSPKTPLITKETIQIPYGENRFLKDESRQATMAAYAGDPVAYARFVKGESATRYAGKAVTGRLFNVALHVAPMPLEPQEGLMGFLGWDSWGNPACVLGQQWPDGRLWILDECVDGEDVRDLLHNSVNPLVHAPRWRDKCYGWRQIGDRTMKQPDQSSHSDCAADVVEQEFDPDVGAVVPFEMGPQLWHHIRLGITHALQWNVRGQPAVLIDPVRCKRLIAGLKGRWAYRINKSGVQVGTTPEKNPASHVCDAWANAVCILMPWSAQIQGQFARKRSFTERKRWKQRAQSYNTPALKVVG